MAQSPSMKMAESGDPRFAYNTTDDLDIREKGEEVSNGVAVHDIDFLGTDGRRIDAYLVTPMLGHSFPGVLFVHPLPGSRKSFLEEAIKLGERRVCSLAVNAHWSEGAEWAMKMGDPEQARAELIGCIKDLRRSMDVLTSQSSVDPNRLGYVGHSLGALCGAVLSGVDRRARAYVLMSGTSSFSEVAQANMPDLKGEGLDHYRQVMADIDPVRFVPQAAPASVMFQMGSNEQYFDHQRMESLARAGSEPKVVHWYDAGHMLDEQARRDRDEWLMEELFR
jgi:dienelactone hydrolase